VPRSGRATRSVARCRRCSRNPSPYAPRAPRPCNALRENGCSVLCTREPGSGDLGAMIREALLSGAAISRETELFLFLADRAEHVARTVRPALARGDIVLCDRFGDSTVAYQGYARGLPIEKLRDLNSLATGGLVPDLTLLFDIEPELGLARLQTKDRIDAESPEFHVLVRQGFLAEMKNDPSRWVRIDAGQAPESVAKEALLSISQRMV